MKLMYAPRSTTEYLVNLIKASCSFQTKELMGPSGDRLQSAWRGAMGQAVTLSLRAWLSLRAPPAQKPPGGGHLRFAPVADFLPH